MSGAEVRRMRLALELDPHAFGRMLGVSMTTVYRWEASGSRRCSAEALQRLLLERLGKLPLRPALGVRVREAADPLHAVQALIEFLLAKK